MVETVIYRILSDPQCIVIVSYDLWAEENQSGECGFFALLPDDDRSTTQKVTALLWGSREKPDAATFLIITASLLQLVADRLT